MGSDESHFTVSLIVRDRVTRQHPLTTTFKKKRDPKQDLNRCPSAYQPIAVPLRQTGSSTAPLRIQHGLEEYIERTNAPPPPPPPTRPLFPWSAFGPHFEHLFPAPSPLEFAFGPHPKNRFPAPSSGSLRSVQTRLWLHAAGPKREGVRHVRAEKTRNNSVRSTQCAAQREKTTNPLRGDNCPFIRNDCVNGKQRGRREGKAF